MKIDFDEIQDARVKTILRRFNIDSVGGLLALKESQLSELKNCGAKTIARFRELQEKYKKYKTAKYGVVVVELHLPDNDTMIFEAELSAKKMTKN